MSPHCHTCGAPVNSLAASGRLACHYCGTVHVLRPDSASVDRLSWLNEIGERDCPLCCTSLAGAVLDGEKVEACPKCLGILLSRSNFATVVTDRRARFRGADEFVRPVDPRTLGQELDCPGCSRKMESHPYYGPGNVAIDSCGACELVWVDSGELTQIERAPGNRAPVMRVETVPYEMPQEDEDPSADGLWGFLQFLLAPKR